MKRPTVEREFADVVEDYGGPSAFADEARTDKSAVCRFANGRGGFSIRRLDKALRRVGLRLGIVARDK
jgi:hypothetical protein